MASGDTLAVFTPYSNEPPATVYATLDTRQGHPVLDFDPTADERAIFSGIMPRHYAGGGVTVYLHWMATSSVTAVEACVWEAAFERLPAADQDLDADGFAAVQFLHGHPSTTNGQITITAIPFTNGAQMDSVVAGDLFRLKINRDADNTNETDNMTGDAELLGIEIKET